MKNTRREEHLFTMSILRNIAVKGILKMPEAGEKGWLLAGKQNPLLWLQPRGHEQQSASDQSNAH